MLKNPDLSCSQGIEQKIATAYVALTTTMVAMVGQLQTVSQQTVSQQPDTMPVLDVKDIQFQKAQDKSQFYADNGQDDVVGNCSR